MVCLRRATQRRQGASSQLRHINVKDRKTIDPGFRPNRKPVGEGFNSGTVVAPLGSILVDLIVGVCDHCFPGVVTTVGPARQPRETRDVSHAEVHVLDAGHFALDTNADEAAAPVHGFMIGQK
jgi:hypothetical protein